MSKCEQTNKLIEIGAQLKQVRETRKIPLHQITSTTLIAERHLKAIEEGDLEQLPEPIYIQGFIRKYGQALGLEQLAEDFPLVGAPQSKPILSIPKTELRPFHLYALYVGVIGIAVSLLANFFNQAKVSTLATGKSNLSKSAVLKPAPRGTNLGKLGSDLVLSAPADQSISTTVEPGSSKEGLAITQKPLKLDISTTAEAWLSVNVDGKVQFEGTLPSGATRNWSADQEIKVLAGNAGAILATFNDQSVGTLGKSGEVVEKSFNLTSQSPAQLPEGVKPDSQNDSTKLVPTNQLPDRSASIINR